LSWKKIGRPQALPGGLAFHRAEAAAKLADWFTGGAQRGELGDRLDFLTGRADRSPADLIRDVGTVKDVARATGAAERTVRDWRAGRHAPSAKHLQALQRAARRATIDALGGTRRVAQLTGRSTRTVQKWAQRSVQVKGDAVHRLNMHEVKERHRRARQSNGQDVGQPLYLKINTAHVRVKASTTTPTYDADRSVCHDLSPAEQEAIVDALARGDRAEVQRIIEQSLTSNYAGLGGSLYDGSEYGFFLDRIDDTEMLTGRG